jgi:hypothetical protein
MQNNTALSTVNSQTGEIIEPVVPTYDGIASKRFTDAQIQILKRDVNPSLVKKRSDGFFYIDGIHYRNALDEAFGPGAWSLLPLREFVEYGVMHTKEGMDKKFARVSLPGQLWIEGRFVAQAIGEDIYYLGNQADSYGTAWEKAKSNLLVRCCKEIGIFRQLWDKDWLESYKRGAGKPPAAQSNGSQNGANKPVDLKKRDPGIPHHQYQEHSAPFQLGATMKLSKERFQQIADHFGIAVERKAGSYKDKNGNDKSFIEYHAAGINDSLANCVPDYILKAHTRRKDDPYDKSRGLWISVSTVAFTLNTLNEFFLHLDEHEHTIKDRRPANDTPLMTHEVEVLPQYANDQPGF